MRPVLWAATALWLAALPLLVQGQQIPSPSLFSLGERAQPGVMGTLSARPLQAGEFALGLHAQGRADMGKDDFVASSVAALSFGMGYGLEAGLRLPYHYQYLPPLEESGLGDPALCVKVALSPAAWLSLALFAEGFAPFSEPDAGLIPGDFSLYPENGSYAGSTSNPFGSTEPRGGGGMAATVDFKPWLAAGEALLHVNLEGRRTLTSPNRGEPGWVKASFAAEGCYRPWLRVSAEYRHEKLVLDALDWTQSPAHANVLGLALSTSGHGFALRLGGQFSPASWSTRLPLSFPQGGGAAYRPYAPASGFLTLSWQGFPLRHDQDGDGFPDRSDPCPFRPEDRDGFQDTDGCPDLDNDGDSMLDSLDKCPFAPEDRDDFQDGDGCADPDNDADGIADGQDACMNDAEDRDRFQDADGCPDLDNDKDGIPDQADKCPDEKEVRNGFEDSDGCPETDTDGDGVPDKADRCPNEAEIVNFFQDTDGCPDQKPEPVRSAILGGVTFIAGTAELSKDSYPELDSLAALMVAYPGTEIEIQGHLDNRSGRAALGLSEAMASSVAGYLAIRGVEPRRMKPVGYGDARPVATNRSASGRQANRRIEIIRLN